MLIRSSSMVSRALPILILALASPAIATAQMVGTSLSGPTTADGASPYYNPAAMGAGRGTHLELDGGLSIVSLGYAPSARGVAPSSTSALSPLLTLGGFTDALHPDWRLGLTVSVPRVSGGSWSRDDGAAQITRYFLVSGATFHIAAIPAVSWSPTEWITIGLGANLVYGSLRGELDKDFGAQLNQTVGSTTIDSPFPYANADLAAPVTLGGTGFGAGAIGGVLVRPIPELSFGASIHSPVLILGQGSLEVSYPERLRQFVTDTLPTAVLPEIAADIELELDVPLLLIAGVSARPHEMIEIAANYQFEHTSSQPNSIIRVTETTSVSPIPDPVKPQGYVDRHRVFLRFALIPIPELRIAIHGVFQSNTVPEDVLAPNNLDYHRVEIGLAVRWRVVEELSLTVQYGHLFLLDHNVEMSLHGPVTQPSLAAFNHPAPTGLYTGAANSIRLGVALHFDDGPEPVEEEDVPLLGE